MKVGLVQINNSYSGQNYLPLSVGLLQAYCQRHLAPGDCEFLLPVYSRIPVERIVAQVEEADIVFFSTYVWNFRISLESAKLLKERKPEIVIVFGGPHVPDRDVEAYHQRYPFIDLACHGEGEAVALSILRNFAQRRWDQISSLSYRAPDGQVMQNPRTLRIKDMSAIPSPYLEGVFEPLLQAHRQEHWIVLWETNRGCPFSCTFCDWGSATQSKVYTFDLERLQQEVEWFAKHRIEYVFCCDANYGILPRDLEITRSVVEVKKKTGYPHAFSVQNTKNATERAYQVQKMLSDAGMNKGVTIALQSMDPETLRSIKRSNISLESYQELQRRFVRDGVETYTDMILGLPGETYDSFAEGVSTVIENGQHNRIQFGNLSILPNAEMGDPEYQRQYGMVTVETQTINMHGSLAESERDEISETQLLVIATHTMPKEDWVRTRAFAWMSAFLHFDKVFQIPLVLVHEIASVSYRELIEIFSERDLRDFPVLSWIQSFFREKAREIQQGGSEFVESKQWLDIWWLTDEFVLIKLAAEGKLGQFYEEAEQAVGRFLKERFLELPADLLKEAVLYNRSLLKMPFQTEDLFLDLSYNIREFHRSVLEGRPIPIEKGCFRYRIDRTGATWSGWEEWCRQVVWYGNKKGAYWYGNNNVEPQLAGHY